MLLFWCFLVCSRGVIRTELRDGYCEEWRVGDG